MANRLQDRILRAYNKPGHPVAFSAPERVANYFGISVGRAKKILEHNETYVAHREYKKPRIYNPYYVHGRRELAQGDLIDIGKISAQNDGVKFLLVLIDVFTKKLWVYPLENKRGRTVERAIKEWLNSLRTTPKKLQTDRGLEFTNALVQRALADKSVEWEPANGTLKAAVAERVNKTLQILIYKYLTQNETVRYIDVLPRLVSTYNKRGHRTLENMSPRDGDKPENEPHLQAIFHERYEKIARHKTKKLSFKVGDLVKVKTEAKKISSSSRAYAEQFKGEYFSVIRINRTMPIALYYLKSVDTGEHIEGGFYAQELQRVRGDVYRIEAVLKRRVRRGVREIYVKWKDFGPQWNEWIREDSVQRVY